MPESTNVFFEAALQLPEEERLSLEMKHHPASGRCYDVRLSVEGDFACRK